MIRAFNVQTSSHFERLATAQLKKHAEFAPLLGQAIRILQIDPYNQSRTNAIKKLTGSQTEGNGDYAWDGGDFVMTSPGKQ
jgi:hypothetical protein